MSQHPFAKLRFPSRSPIGLDIGGRYVKAVQLERAHGKGGWRVACAAQFNRTKRDAAVEPAELHDAMKVLYRQGFTGNRVVVPVPPEKLLSGVLDVPPRTAQAPVEQIARLELARTSRCQPDSFEMGYWDLPAPARANRAAQVMAVGCTHANASSMLATFDDEGLDVVALDVRACALARAIAPLFPSDAGVDAVLELGWSAATLVMRCAGAIVYTRSLPDVGLRPLHEALVRRLGLEPDVADYLLSDIGLGEGAAEVPPETRATLTTFLDGLAQELTVSMSYVSREYSDSPLTRLLLTGTGASMPGLSPHLVRGLEVQVQAVAPRDLLECPPALFDACGSHGLTAAVGLAEFGGS